MNLPGVKDQDRALELVGQTGRAPLPARAAEALAPDDADAGRHQRPPSGAPTTTAAGPRPPCAGATTTAAGRRRPCRRRHDRAGRPRTDAGDHGAAADDHDGWPPTVAARPRPREQDDPDARRSCSPSSTTTATSCCATAWARLPDRRAPSPAPGPVFQGNEWQVEARPQGRRGRHRHLERVGGRSASTGEADCPTGQAWPSCSTATWSSAPDLQTPQLLRHHRVRSPVAAAASARPRPRTWPWCCATASLPVELEPQAVQTVSATLGQGLAARRHRSPGCVGLALVAGLHDPLLPGPRPGGAGRPVRHRRRCCGRRSPYLGENNGLALTLAGATGIIVSIGVTVDSYVVYFERLKDEVRAGKSLRARPPPRASRRPTARSWPPTWCR